MHLAVIAWRGLAARPGRTLLTVAALAIGVAAFTATLLAADSAQQAVSRAGAELLGHAELRVRALRDDGISARALDVLRSLPGVRLAAPVAERAAASHPRAACRHRPGGARRWRGRDHVAGRARRVLRYAGPGCCHRPRRGCRTSLRGGPRAP